MIRVLQEIFENTLARLSHHLITYIPPLLVASVIMCAAFLLAVSIRWLIVKVIKGAALHRFLRDSGLSSVVTGPEKCARPRSWQVQPTG